MFGRVVSFGTDNTTDFPAGTDAQKRFANVRQIIQDLDKAKAGQQAGGNTAKAVLLDGLRLDIQNIARTASAIDLDEPGFADKFPFPPSGSDADLLTSADACIERLKEKPADDAATKAAKAALVAKFLAYELPAGFVQDLAEDRAAIEAAQDELESGRSSGVASTAAVGRLIREGAKEITHLDAIMHNKYARNPDKLRAWESASHIERAPQREKTPANVTTVNIPQPTSVAA